MRIEVKRIKNVKNWLGRLAAGQAFRVCCTGDRGTLLARVGLPTNALDGSTILPSIVGSISRFNADGKWISLRDLPKESRYVQTVEWSWTTYDGTEHTDFKDIFRFCYQREHIAPPSLELEFLEVDGQSLIISPEMRNIDADIEANGHAINLFLELFGLCDLVQSNLKAITPPVLKKANWRLLPSGQHPFEQIKSHVKSAVRHMSDATCNVIMDRQRALEELQPNEMWIGEGGFNDYVAYVFAPFGIVVLESVRRDNAIYVFTNNWQAVSKLTKAEILKASLHHSRIVHTEGWKGRLAQLFTKKAA